MKDFATTARKALIRMGKSLPFILCFIILISYLENIYAIATNDYINYGGCLIYNTPVSFYIGAFAEYDIVFMVAVTIISIAIEVCIYNLIAVAYCWFNILQRYLLWEYGPFDNEIYYIVAIANVAFAAWITYKGISILFTKT